MKESDISRAIQIAATQEGWRLFRQNVGSGWVGEIIRRTRDSILLRHPRPLRAGLTVGSGDLIGWASVLIEGRTVGVFLSVEVKTTRGRMTSEQENFRKAVNRAGGIAVVATSPPDAIKKIKDRIAELTS